MTTVSPFTFTDEELQAMPDGALANAFTSAVLIAHKVITVRDGSADPVRVADLYDRLAGEIAARDKHWAPMLFGGQAALQTGTRGYATCGFYLAPNRATSTYFGRVCHRREGALVDPTTRRVRCNLHRFSVIKDC